MGPRAYVGAAIGFLLGFLISQWFVANAPVYLTDGNATHYLRANSTGFVSINLPEGNYAMYAALSKPPKSALRLGKRFDAVLFPDVPPFLMGPPVHAGKPLLFRNKAADSNSFAGIESGWNEPRIILSLTHP